MREKGNSKNNIKAMANLFKDKTSIVNKASSLSIAINHVFEISTIRINLAQLRMPFNQYLFLTYGKVFTDAKLRFLKNLHRLSLAKNLKELRNCISRITRMWPLFCSLRVYTSLHFLSILLGN